MDINGNGGKRTSQGRQKIKIARIEDKNRRQVTFSKRRPGIFRKASELCVLTGAEVAVIVHSEGKRVFTFGHPAVDLVVDRFLSGGGDADAQETRPPWDVEARYAGICEELEAEKRLQEAIEAAGGGGGSLWWDAAVDWMGLEDLEQYAEALEELTKKAAARADDLMNARVSAGGGEALPEDVTALLSGGQWGGGFGNDDCVFPDGFGQEQV